MSSAQKLAARLLDRSKGRDQAEAADGVGAPEAGASGSRRRWAYPVWGMVLASMFIAYHVTVLGIWNLPARGLTKRFNQDYLRKTHGRDYFYATSNNQSWAMFAPNPNRTNVFIRVLVNDQDGEVWDMKHDIWQVDRHPYWFYARRGKINRRIDGKKHYQRAYGAYVCREWARAHEGEIPASVTFVKRWYRVPKPKKAWASGGYEPWEAKTRQRYQETIPCHSTVHAQLPPELVERYGFDAAGAPRFKPTRQRTWWDQAKSKAEREKRKASSAAGPIAPRS